jgi:hypothetical protein
MQRDALLHLHEGGHPVDDLDDAFIGCVPAGDGGWGLVARNIAEGEGDYATQEVIEFEVTFCPDDGVCRTASGFELVEVQDWGSQYLHTLVAADLNGDGRSELHLVIGHADEGYDTFDPFLLGVVEDGLAPVEIAGLPPIAQWTSIIDRDDDGLADVAFTPMTSWISGGFDGILVGEVVFLAHQRPGGQWVVDDDISRQYASAQCTEEARELARGESRADLVYDLLCDRILDRDAGTRFGTYRAECAAHPNEYDCEDLEVMGAYLTRPLPWQDAP